MLGVLLSSAPAYVSATEETHWTLRFSPVASGEVSGSVSADMDSGHQIAFSFGESLKDQLQMELELDFAQQELGDFSQQGYSNGDEPKVLSVSVLGNIIRRFEGGRPWTPYILAGVGVTYIQLRDTRKISGWTFCGGGDCESSQDDQALIYQVGAGTRFRVNNRYSITLDYRYTVTGDMEFDDLSAQPFDLKVKGQYLGIGVYEVF